jgi:hypothetical protein
MRKQWNQKLKPIRDVPCPRSLCVYNEDGICDEPWINYGNSDAECHDMTYKEVVTMLDVEATNEST